MFASVQVYSKFLWVHAYQSDLEYYFDIRGRDFVPQSITVPSFLKQTYQFTYAPEGVSLYVLSGTQEKPKTDTDKADKTVAGKNAT